MKTIIRVHMKKTKQLRLLHIAAVLALTMAIMLVSCGKADAGGGSSSDGSSKGSASEVTDEKSGETAKPEDSELYDQFEANEAKALYRGKDGDRSGLLSLSSALEEGKSYTINQIIYLVQNSGPMPNKAEPELEYERIDCGSDGIAELLTTMTMGSMRLYMILKDIDGELVICYAESASISQNTPLAKIEVKINDDGTTSKIMDPGEGKVAFEEYSIIDAAGDYHLYYGLETTTTFYADYYFTKDADNKIKISPNGLDSEHIVLYEYYFSPDEHYMTYSMIDDDGKDVTTDADYDDSNKVVQQFAREGVKIYTAKEIEDMLSQRAKELNYPAD